MLASTEEKCLRVMHAGILWIDTVVEEYNHRLFVNRFRMKSAELMTFNSCEVQDEMIERKNIITCENHLQGHTDKLAGISHLSQNRYVTQRRSAE